MGEGVRKENDLTSTTAPSKYKNGRTQWQGSPTRSKQNKTKQTNKDHTGDLRGGKTTTWRPLTAGASGDWPRGGGRAMGGVGRTMPPPPPIASASSYATTPTRA